MHTAEGGAQLAAFARLYGSKTLAVKVPCSAAPAGNGSIVVVVHDGHGRILVEQHSLVLSLPTVERITGPIVMEVADLLERLAPRARPGELLPLGTIESGSGQDAERALAVLLRANSLFVEDAAFALVELSALSRSNRITELERRVLKAAQDLLDAGVTEVPRAEVDAASEHPLRHAIHRRLIKPLIWPFSSRRLRQRIMPCAGEAVTILDVACGDDHLAVDLAKTGAVCVANDAAARSMVELARADTAGRVLLTVHNLTDLPYGAIFDVAIAKNVIHHLDPAECAGLFRTLRKCARRMLFVDIVDVEKSWRALAWNAYYRHWLGDQGAPRLSSKDFEQLIRDAFPDRQVTFEAVETIKGRYAVCLVDREGVG